MGRPKEWLPWEGGTVLQHVVDVVRSVVRPVVVAGRRGQTLPALPADVERVADAAENVGPLAGIAAGLAALEGRCEAAFVTACDHPALSAGVIGRLVTLLGESRAIVVTHEGRVNPLLGVYRLSCRPMAEDLMRRGESAVDRLVVACAARVVDAAAFADLDETLASFRSVNDPASYERARKKP